MEKRTTTFIFSKQALERYNEIEKYAYNKYKKVPSFVGRYLNYVVSYADVLLVSDAIGAFFSGMTKEQNLSDFKSLRDLVSLASETVLEESEDRLVERNSGELVPRASDYIVCTSTLSTTSTLFKISNAANDANPLIPLIVAREYIDRAWRIIEPCIAYVNDDLVDYVSLDKPLAKLREYVKRTKTTNHSDAMRNCHLSKKDMDLAVQSLIEMEEIDKVVDPHTRKITYVWVGDTQKR